MLRAHRMHPSKGTFSLNAQIEFYLCFVGQGNIYFHIIFVIYFVVSSAHGSIKEHFAKWANTQWLLDSYKRQNAL